MNERRAEVISDNSVPSRRRSRLSRVTNWILLGAVLLFVLFAVGQWVYLEIFGPF